MWRAVTTRTGPNDASHVVWAIGKFFIYIFFLCFFILNKCFILYIGFKLGNIRHGGREWAQTTRLASFGP